MKYRVTRHYSSDWGTLARGSVVDLDDDTAAWLGRDAPGILEPVTEEPEPIVRKLDEPDRTRQIVRPQVKRGPVVRRAKASGK